MMQDKSLSKSVNRVPSPQLAGGQDQSHDQVHMPPRDTREERDKSQVVQVVTPLTLFQGKIDTPPFLISVCVFGENLHNCLLDSGASTNVMPLGVCRAMGITLADSQKVTQRDKTELNIVG